jgi:hypothetical protein
VKKESPFGVPVIAGLILFAAALLIPIDFGITSRVFGDAWDWLHVPAFFVLTLLVGFMMRPAPRSRLDRWGVPLTALATAVLFECVQPLVGRSAGMGDILLGAAGIAVAQTWRMKRAGALRAVGVSAVILSVTFVPMLLQTIEAVRLHRDFPLLAGFERWHELSRWSAKSVALERVARHEVEGSWSGMLRVQGVDEAFPGAFLEDFPHDWSAYDTWKVDVYVPEQMEGTLWVRMDDSLDDPPYEDRFQKSFHLKAGAHELSIPLDAMRTPGGRLLERGHIMTVGLFFSDAIDGNTVYVDAMRLEKGADE